jgi:hypothetical protein
MNDVQPVSVHLASHFKLSSSLCRKSNVWPDISHVVGVVSRFMGNPGKEHWEIVKWVLWYLRGTSDYLTVVVS